MTLPNRKEQIVLAHAMFIRQVVEFGQSADRRPELEALLSTATEAGWSNLVHAIRDILKGHRDLDRIQGLDEEDQAIAEAILAGLQDPSTLPDPAKQHNPALAAPGLAHMIHAAATGNPQALVLLGEMAEQMNKAGGDMARIAGAIRPMINGERDPERLAGKMNSQTEKLLVNILAELAKLENH